jgi:dTDP-glucose 4,6-dehydratase
MARSSWLDNAKVLVTGGAGFIGSHFVKLLLAKHKGCRVVVLDKLTYAGSLFNLESAAKDLRFSFIKGDICDRRDVEKAYAGCNAIVNFAAETHVDRSIVAPASFVMTDTFGVYVLMEVAKEKSIERFLQISTDEVYGEVLGEPVDEDAPLMPRNPYSASKAGGDRLAFSYFATYGLPVVITRCSNNYGPNQYPEKMVSLFITNAMEDKPLPVYGTGLNKRDWIFVRDHCEALESLLIAEGLEGQVFNIGTGSELNVLEVSKGILRALGKPESLVAHIKDRPGHDRRYSMKTEKLRKATGWRPSMTFEVGLSETVKWYADNRKWWEAIKSGEFKEYYAKAYKFEK